MNRKKLLITISVLFVVVGIVLVGGYFYLTNTRQAPKETPVVTTGSLAETGMTDNASSSGEVIIDASSTPGELPKLRQLTTTPVAGYDFVDQGKGFVIWYVDRATGNIFQTATNTLDITRVTHTTIPEVYEAYIGKGGANVVLRTLNDSTGAIQTFIGSPKTPKISTTSTDFVKELTGVFTSDTISSLSLSPSKDKFFGMTGSSVGIGNIYSFSAKSSNIFSNPLKRWVPQWINTSTILLTSAPSAKTQNVSYFLSTAGGGLTKVLGPKNGLVVSASSDGAHLLFSENKNNTLTFGLYSPKTGTETSLSSATIPDKCVWSKKDPSVAYCGFPKNTAGIFPDDWYQGKVLFSDSIRSLDTNTLQFNTIADLDSQSHTDIDATNLTLSSDEHFLLFTNKRDLTLWMLEL